MRKILMGLDLGKAISRDAMMNPQSIEFFIRVADEQRDYSLGT